MSNKLRDAFADVELCAAMEDLAAQLQAHGIDGSDRGVVLGLARVAVDRAYEAGRTRGADDYAEHLTEVEP